MAELSADVVVTLTNLKKEYQSICGEITSQSVAANSNIKPEIVASRYIEAISQMESRYKDLFASNEEIAKRFREMAEEIAKDAATEFVNNASKRGAIGINRDVDPYTSGGKSAGYGMTFTSEYHATNSTYSGADIVASITIPTGNGVINKTIGSLQTLSYSIYQPKAPVRCLGNMNAKDWVFGPRTIAGSLVFTVFNKHWLMSIYDEIKKDGKMQNWHFLADEIPPFDITISFANEFGYDSRMAIYGVRLMNEGKVLSMNDIYIENTYQFVANDIEMLDSLNAYQVGETRHKYSAIAVGNTADILKKEDVNLSEIISNTSSSEDISKAASDYNFDTNLYSEATLSGKTEKNAKNDLKEYKSAQKKAIEKTYDDAVKAIEADSSKTKEQKKEEKKKAKLKRDQDKEALNFYYDMAKETIENYYDAKEKEAEKAKKAEEGNK